MIKYAKWSSSGVLFVALAAGTAVHAADRKAIVRKMSAAELEQRAIINRVDHGRQEVERKGDDLVRNANLKLAAGEYMEACNLYRIAKTEFKKFNSPYFARRIAFCDRQIARCYYVQAESAIRDADKSSQRGDFETAIRLCREALKYCPEQADRLENLIVQYEKRKNYAIERDNTGVGKLIPDKKNQDYQIEVLLEQGRKLVAAGELGEAVRKYQEIMLIDPYNAAAVKSLEGVYTRIAKIGKERFRTTHRRMVSETEWKFSSPVFPENDGQGHTVNFVAGENKNKPNIGTAAITKKLNSIIIKEFGFEDIPLSVVVNHLREFAKQHDPANIGINFVYLPKNVERAAAAPIAGASASRNDEGETDGGGAGGPAAAAPSAAAPAAGGGQGGGDGGDAPQEKTITYRRNGVSVMDVLRDFSREYGVKYKITDNYVIIAPSHVSVGDMESRVFNVEIKDFQSNEKLKDDLVADGISYGPGTDIFYDKNISCVFATNTVDNLEKTEKFLEREYNHTEPMIQVMLKVIEISQKDINELAFNWQYAVNSRTSTVNSQGDRKMNTVIAANSNELLRYYRPNDSNSEYSGQVPDSQLSYVWENSDGTKLVASMFALNWADSGDVLYSPRVTVLNNQVGTVIMGTLRYFPDDWELIDITESNEEIGWRMIDASPQPNLDNEQTLGFPFQVLPSILDDGRVIEARIKFKTRTFVDWMVFDARERSGDTEGGSSSSDDGEYYKMPIFNDREIDTHVQVYDGDTVLVGGVATDLTKTYNDKIPILGDLPFIGRFFQSRYSEAEKGNLLIFLTCRIVNPDGSAKYPEGKRPNGVANFGQNL